LVVALTVTADPIHDIGLFAFEAAWVGLGIALLRAKHRQAHSKIPETQDRSVATADN
jgi:hypothetical protein